MKVVFDPAGIRDLGFLDSAVAQPRATFGGSDLHATVSDKRPTLQKKR
jgi:death-on-curing protein